MKLRELINYLDLDDLKKIKSDLEEHGGTYLLRIVNKKLDEATDMKGICAVCGQKLTQTTPEIFSVVFGPPDFRKKASFCAKDCMDYFVQSLKNDTITMGGKNGL